MMRSKIILVVIGLFLLSTFTIRLSATPQASISVSNADASRTLDSAASGSLISVLSTIPQHIAVQFANSVRRFPLIQPSAPLTTKLDGVRSRVSVQFANGIRRMPLNSPSAQLAGKLDSIRQRVAVQFANGLRRQSLEAPQAGLATKLNQLPDRVAMQFANAGRTIPLNFPNSLIQDVTQPQIVVLPEVETVEADTVEIKWTTNEFTIVEIQYGASSGNYTVTLTSNSYETSHNIQITQLVSNQTYYFTLIVTDLSGNRLKMPEANFIVAEDSSNPSDPSKQFVYLPLVVRR